MIYALRDEVIIKPLFEQQKGLVYIPKAALKYKQYDGKVVAEVVSIGKDYPYKDDLKVGDKICFQHLEGVKIKYDGELYLKLKERWVLGVIDDTI